MRAARIGLGIAAAVAAGAALAASAGCKRGGGGSSGGGAPAPGSASGGAPAGSASGGGPAAAGSAGAGAACTELPFAASTPLPEASGAAWLELDGAPRLLAIADSGHRGAYAILDPDTGETLEQGALPLGPDGDDLEGAAARGGRLYTLTSSGWVRVHARANGGRGPGFELVDGPYPIGPVERGGPACALPRVNCGRDYEGLCLAPGAARGPCVGFAASKDDGRLYCLAERDGRLHVADAPPIEVAPRETLADCAFAEDGRLYTGANLLALGAVLRVHGWDDPARARLAAVPANGAGSPETLAVRGDVFYRMSDAGAAPSLVKRYRCTEP